jgi:hypothetical protein
MAHDESPYLSAILLLIGLGSSSSGCNGCGEAGRAARASVACSKACQAGLSVAPSGRERGCREACLARLNGSGATCRSALVEWVECLADGAKSSPQDSPDLNQDRSGAATIGVRAAEPFAHCARLEDLASQCEAGCRAEGRLDVGQVVIQGNERPRDVRFELLDCGCVPCGTMVGADPTSVCQSAKVCRPIAVSCDGAARSKLLRACVDGRCVTPVAASELLGDLVHGATCTVVSSPPSK